jgi:signal transduction histidine kinase
VTAREEERRRLRRDLHDGLGPTLAAISVRAGAAARLARQRPELAEAALTTIAADAQAAVTEVRRVVHELRPPALDQLGLAGALSAQAQRFAPALDVVVDVTGDVGGLPAAVEVAAYRVASEAVTNALRHARCSACTVDLGVEGGGLALEVRDDGAGIAADATSHVGLESMRERAVELGGRLEIDTGPHGTAVRAWLPLEG